MAWYWIILIIWGYVAIAALLFRLFEKNSDDTPAYAALSILWPLALLIFVLVWPAFIITGTFFKK